MDWATQSDDLSAYLASNNEDLTQIIQERYRIQRPVSMIGPQNMVTMECYETGLSHQYKILAEQTMQGETISTLPPHILLLASNVYSEMLAARKDQTVLIWGESGSGKSLNRSQFSKQLIDTAKNGKKKSKVLSGALKMETVLNSFGSYKTRYQKNASGYGRYVEYQYTKSGRMVGIKLLDYGFNKARVTNALSLGDGERSYNVFYELLSGATAEEREKLSLGDGTTFAYTKGAHMSPTLARSGTLGRLTLGRSKSLSRSKSVSHKPTPAHRDATPTAEDAQQMGLLREHMKSLGIGKRTQAQIYKLLAGILHLGNILFADLSEKEQEASDIKNPEELEIAASLLGITAESLKNTILYKSKVVGNDTFSIYLKADQATKHRDLLAQTLYGLLFTWIVEHINTRLCKPESEKECCISIADFLSIQGVPQGLHSARFETIFSNYVYERMLNESQCALFDEPAVVFRNQGLRIDEFPYNDNQIILDLFDGTTRQSGLWSVLESSVKIEIPKESTFGHEVVYNLDKTFNSNASYIKSYDCNQIEKTSTGSSKPLFGIRHYMNERGVEYDVESFFEEDAVLSDFVSLFRGSINFNAPEKESSFISSLFSPKNGFQVIKIDGKALTRKKSMLRRPSMKGKPSDEILVVAKTHFSDARATVDSLVSSIKNARKWNIFCINPRDENGQFDLIKIRKQIEDMNLGALAKMKSIYNVELDDGISYEEFLQKYGALINTRGTGPPSELVKQFINGNWWPARDILMGGSVVYLALNRVRWLNNSLISIQAGTLIDADESTSIGSSDWESKQERFGKDEDLFSETDSVGDSEFRYAEEVRRGTNGPYNRDSDDKEGAERSNDFANIPNSNEIIEKEEDLSFSRKCWTCCTWALTWWVPTPCLSCCGMKRPDIRMAWREKLALCIIIGFLCLSLLFFIVGLRFVICPPIAVKSLEEIKTMSFERVGDGRNAIFAAYGRYYDAEPLMRSHKKDFGEGSGAGAVDNFLFEEYYGEDVSNLFFKADAWEYYCPGIPRPPDGWDNLDSNIDWMRRGKKQPKYDSVHRNNAPGGTPQLYADNLLRYAKGRVGWSLKTLESISSMTEIYIVLFNNVYYTSTMQIINVFPAEFRELFGANNQGTDITAKYKAARDRNPAAFDSALRCANQMFYIGTVDRRESIKCTFSNVVLLGASIVLVAVIGFKFLAALQFGSKKEPELANKFCILMVPCYTEGLESLSKTIDSLATMRYDDKRKLLFIICDGMIIGSGNDRPTPRIVLDLLGVDASQDPAPKAFHSLGEGMKQYNMGKVYSGLYEIRGHSVPFVVVVKCGSPTERVKPGNRGKRDSQLILMRFLNRVHFNAEMSPMELEIYHQMKNVIGVTPSFYEFCLMVDADTEVQESALNRMVSVMVNDAKVIGLCGETRIANEKDSWVTMIQVYEYFISHHLAKAFESLFGTVTCLPGCFSIYRIRSATKNIPVLVSPAILEEYSENTVDTLHKKNLLHLGEDRYLTTLLLKHFPTMRTKFTAEARCVTVVPDRWDVLLSQRRRWINSTVHNLLELSLIDQLCGFCCFSMRFVVMLDLFATFVQPATVLYICYLIYAVITSREEFPLLSLVLIGAIYGLQVIIFIAKREWQHIAWMFIYIAATPVISFYIPCYAFWHFDDFSWGNTRVVVGEGKKTVYVANTEKFDPNLIKTRRWRDFDENGLDKKSEFGGSEYSSISSMVPSRADELVRTGRPSELRESMVSLGVARRPSDLRDGVLTIGAMRNNVAAGRPTELRDSMYGRQPGMRESMLSMGGVPRQADSVRSSAVSEIAAEGLQPVQISDEMLYAEIKTTLMGADLMTLTKKQIRDKLSVRLGMDLRSKKEVMNRMIDEILSKQ